MYNRSKITINRKITITQPSNDKAASAKPIQIQEHLLPISPISSHGIHVESPDEKVKIALEKREIEGIDLNIECLNKNLVVNEYLIETSQSVAPRSGASSSIPALSMNNLVLKEDNSVAVEPKLSPHSNILKKKSAITQKLGRDQWMRKLFALIRLKKSPESIGEFIKDYKLSAPLSVTMNKTLSISFDDNNNNNNNQELTPFLFAVLNKEYSTALSFIKLGADPFLMPLGIQPLKEIVGNEGFWFYMTIEAMRPWKPFLTVEDKKQLKFSHFSTINQQTRATQQILNNRVEQESFANRLKSSLKGLK